MKHFVRCEVGVNKGLVYTVRSKKEANQLIRLISRRFYGVSDSIYAASYGNENDGFIRQTLKRGGRFMSETYGLGAII
jgi:hypothetical protein